MVHDLHLQATALLMGVHRTSRTWLPCANVLLPMALAGSRHGGRSSGAEDEEDMLAFKPRPSQLAAAAALRPEPASEEDGATQPKAGVYRPPKLNPVSMDG